MIKRLKDWILTRQFVILYGIDQYEKGYVNGEADAIKYAEIEIKEGVEKKVADLLGYYDERLTLTVDSKAGKVYIGGVLADPGRLGNLKQEAEFIEKTDLWGILNHTFGKITHEIMFNKSQNFDDMKNGKSILYTLSFQNNVIRVLKTFQAPKMPKK